MLEWKGVRSIDRLQCASVLAIALTLRCRFLDTSARTVLPRDAFELAFVSGWPRRETSCLRHPARNQSICLIIHCVACAANQSKAE